MRDRSCELNQNHHERMKAGFRRGPAFIRSSPLECKFRLPCLTDKCTQLQYVVVRIAHTLPRHVTKIPSGPNTFARWPMNNPTPDVIRLSLENRILQDLIALGELIPDDGIRVQTVFKGRVVTVQVSPVPGSPTPLSDRTECERDCFEAVRSAGRGITRTDVKSALEKAGKIWGDSTIAYALADLVSDGLLENSRKRGGYYIPERPA